MLLFSDWTIKTDGDLIARQYDNLSRELLVMGTLPEGWAWELLVQAGGSVNVIALSPRKGGVGVTLTAEMLTKAGLYALQLRGGRGEEVRHTNVIQVVVPTSLVGDATWPELPSEFSQAEANIRALNAHPPYAGSNGYWMIWDLETGDYVESQLPLPEVSVGPQGPEGKAASIRVGSVLTGEPGAQAAVSNSGTENDAILDFVLPRGQIGPTGPSGADGRDGKDGVPGAAATIQVGAVTTGEPGTQAQVVNAGTENAAVLQFTIPQGRPGADGMDGKDGRDGEPGPAGVGVPEISDGDEGKVMTARNGYAVWETPQGGSGGGVQPDWNQNDPQAADFIKNRPGGYSVQNEVLSKTTVTASASGGYNLFSIPSSLEIDEGRSYIVTFDDESYECEPILSGVSYGIGNPLYFDAGDDNGMPFGVVGGGGELTGVSDTPGEHTISIIAIDPIRFEKKYLPPALEFDVDNTDAATAYEIVEQAYLSGEPLSVTEGIRRFSILSIYFDSETGRYRLDAAFGDDITNKFYTQAIGVSKSDIDTGLANGTIAIPSTGGVSNAGKVLGVSNRGLWAVLDSPVPKYTAQDEGKVMTVRSGQAVWETFRGGASNPVLLTGFQPDPDDPFMMTQILALTDQQFEAVQAAFKAGQPVNVENVYLCYPSWDRTESIEFSSGTLGSSPFLGMFANLSVGQEDKTARLKQAPTTVEPMFLTSFDGPGSVDDTMLAAFAAQAYRTYVPLSIHVKTENHVLYPSSDTGELYEYANFHYRLTSNPELGILTLATR